MQRNVYIAYALWFFLGHCGAHRIYCGKFSGVLQLLLFWVGMATAIFFVGYIFLAIWGIWWIFDAFWTTKMVYKINEANKLEESLSQARNIKNIEKLYELYKSGAISEDEYNRRKAAII